MSESAWSASRTRKRARELAADLVARGVRTVALTFVDNAGITRVKAVPVTRLEHAAGWGVGMSPVFDVFCVDDSITTSRHIGGPAGDLRLYPDLNRLVPLHAQPGWAWAPVVRLTQDGDPYPGCQRGFAARMVERGHEAGLDLRMAFEVEWFVGAPDLTPACGGPAYGMTRLVELSRYADDLLAALEAQGVPVDQFHPEYAPGQLEVSVAASDPISAADRLILVRQTIRAVSQAHGHVVSFAPVVVAGQVGNGGHLHLSGWSTGAQPVRRRRRPLRAHGARRIDSGGTAAAPAGAVRDRLTEPGQLPAPRAPAVGRAVAVLGSGEPGGGPSPRHRYDRRALRRPRTRS